MSRFSRVKASQDQEEPNERNSVKEREDTFKTRRSDKAKDRDQTKEKESFEPFIYASHAYTFLSSVLAKYQPTHILIERQRYRSMGSSAILEWTVRVNMFEGMLYAVLRTLKERGDWNGGVRGVLPAKVAAFWLDPENLIDCGLGGDDGLVLKEILPGSNKKSEIEKNGEIKQAKLGKKKKDNKTAKINLVTHWLEYKRMVEFNTTLSQRTAEAFLARAQGRTKNPSDSAKKKKTNPKHRKSSMVEAQGSTEGEIDNEEGIEIEKITKLDDLADCLLQGIAWVKWEENKRVLLPLLVPSSGNEL
ncbi:MAG: hypothetical protein M1823_000575 [Watsoniomyces obsoletus]|nr:MAG: hypothetical protein M1823_000575 [Watsoniomyces obsoletus]